MTAQNSGAVFVGVDTHADFHVASAVTPTGERLGTIRVASTLEGSTELIGWAAGLGVVEAFGIEGTGSYGAGVARHVRSNGFVVLEVNRPNRQHRYRYGKSDTADAVAAAAAAAAGLAQPAKELTGTLCGVRATHRARQAAVAARTRVINQIHQFVVCAPEEINTALRNMSSAAMIRAINDHTGANDASIDVELGWVTLQSLARQHAMLTSEIRELERHRNRLCDELVPTLLAIDGVGPGVAAELVLAAGANPDRFTSEAAFAALCGVSPVDASSGKGQHHRLNRGGNRQANCALHTIALYRARVDEESIAYIAKKRAEGKTARDAMRCLKRHIARRVFHALKHDLTNHQLT